VRGEEERGSNGNEEQGKKRGGEGGGRDATNPFYPLTMSYLRGGRKKKEEKVAVAISCP